MSKLRSVALGISIAFISAAAPLNTQIEPGKTFCGLVVGKPVPSSYGREWGLVATFHPPKKRAERAGFTFLPRGQKDRGLCLMVFLAGTRRDSPIENIQAGLEYFPQARLGYDTLYRMPFDRLHKLHPRGERIDRDDVFTWHCPARGISFGCGYVMDGRNDIGVENISIFAPASR